MSDNEDRVIIILKAHDAAMDLKAQDSPHAWLAYELIRALQPTTGRPGIVGTGCRRCGGPIERVKRGRPRLHCEECRKPRRKDAD